MKYILLLMIFALTGCSTVVPVKTKFPDAPDILFEKCPTLKIVETVPATIIDITKVVTINYTTYYECAAKMDGWIEWHAKQKQIFEEVSK